MRRQWRFSRFAVMAGMVGLLAVFLSAIWAPSPLSADELDDLKKACETAGLGGETALNIFETAIDHVEVEVNITNAALPRLLQVKKNAKAAVKAAREDLDKMATETGIVALAERDAKREVDKLRKKHHDESTALLVEYAALPGKIATSNTLIDAAEKEKIRLSHSFSINVKDQVKDQQDVIDAEKRNIEKANERMVKIQQELTELQNQLQKDLAVVNDLKDKKIAEDKSKRVKAVAGLKQWQEKLDKAKREHDDAVKFVTKGKLAIPKIRDCIKKQRKKSAATTSTTTTTTSTTTTTTTSTTLQPTTTTTTTTLPPLPPPRGAKLTVSVLDEATRRPVPNMRVDLTPLVGWKTFLRGPDRMVFEGLPRDSYTVTAEAEGYTSGSDRVIVTEQRDYLVVIWLKKKEEKKAPTPSLTARLDCGGLLELVPGENSKRCTVIIEGLRSNTADRVEVVVLPNPPPGGIEVSHANWSMDPHSALVSQTSTGNSAHVSEAFSARESAPPGTTPFTITVRQRGAGAVTLPLTVIVLPKKGGPVGPALGGAPGGPGVPAPTASAAAGRLRARLECGGVLEVVPGQGSTDCDVILEGWSRSSSERVEVELVYPRQTSGIEVTPGNTSAPPENMWPNSNNEYVFGEGFSARSNAPPGTTPIIVRVRQRGAGEAMLSLNVTVLPKKGGPFGAVPAPAGGPGGAGLPAPTPTGTSGQLSAELDCGGSFELAPGAFDGRNCGIVVRGWRSDTTNPVEVEVVYPRQASGIDVSPGNTSQDPGNMHTTSASDYHDRYVFGQTFRAKDNAPPGTTPIRITVRQRGAGQINLTLNVAVLPKGLLPSSGPGIRPPATVTTGSGGEYCVWRYKLIGDPPSCFHFWAKPCGTYVSPGYELVGQNMTWGQADARVGELGRYYTDAYGCRVAAAQPSTTTTTLPPITRLPLPPSSLPPPSEEPPQSLRRVLSRFGVVPDKVTLTVGESRSFKAYGVYSGSDPDKPVDLTGKAIWSPGRVFTAKEPGEYIVTATFEGASDTATVIVEDEKKGSTNDGGKKPDIKGATEKGTTFQGQTPGGKPSESTSGAAGDGQPIDQPGLEPPAGTEPSTAGTGGLAGSGVGQGVMCYSEKTKEQYWMQMGPCPPPWMKPPAGTTTASRPPGRTPWKGLIPGRETPGTGTELPPHKPSAPPAKIPPTTPGSGGQEVDLSGTWHATYSAFPLGNLRFTMTLRRVAAGKWQGPLDYVVVDCPEMSFKTQATLQASGVGKVHLTYNTPAKECPRYVGKIGAGAQQADGTYTSSQITFGSPPNTVTYTRR